MAAKGKKKAPKREPKEFRLVGKTIASYRDEGDGLILVFTDQTSLSIEPYASGYDYDSVGLTFSQCEEVQKTVTEKIHHDVKLV